MTIEGMSSCSEVYVNDLGIFTEATIDVIRIESTKKEIRIDVTCRWEGEKRKQIVARGVEDFVASDLRLSNIIDRVTLHGTSEAQEAETAKRLFFMMRGREPDISDLEWPKLSEKLDSIRARALILIELEPVYGATIIILAESIQFEFLDMY